jgi:predicted MPP superfamily phosphohydrolase
MAMGGYAAQIEPHHLVVEGRTIRLPHISPALDGFRIALMSDHHLFPFTPRELLERAVEQTNALRPDLILLAGDYVYTDIESIRELAPILGGLNAKYGVFAILGNYDCLRQPDLIRANSLPNPLRCWLTAACTWDRAPDDSSWPGWIRFGGVR